MVTARDIDNRRHQVGKLRRLETRFADLNERHTGGHRLLYHPDDRVPRDLEAITARDEPPAVGDQAHHGAIKVHRGALESKTGARDRPGRR